MNNNWSDKVNIALSMVSNVLDNIKNSASPFKKEPDGDEEGVDLSYYASLYINNYKEAIRIPTRNLKYLNSGLVPSTMYSFLKGMENLIIVPKIDIDTSNCMDFAASFSCLNDIEQINLQWLRGTHATSLDEMFYRDYNLKTVDLSKFNANRVLSATHMFAFDKNLKVIDLSGIDTSTIKYWSFMFYKCEKLERIEGVLDFSNRVAANDIFTGTGLLLKDVKVRNIGDRKTFENWSGLKSSQYTIVD